MLRIRPRRGKNARGVLELGYLAYDRDHFEAYIPTEEVRSAFEEAVRMSNLTPVIQAIQASDGLLKAMWRKDAEAVAEAIDEVHRARKENIQMY